MILICEDGKRNEIAKRLIRLTMWYRKTLWLRSHVLGVMYDMMEFGSAAKRSIGEVLVSQD